MGGRTGRVGVGVVAATLCLSACASTGRSSPRAAGPSTEKYGLSISSPGATAAVPLSPLSCPRSPQASTYRCAPSDVTPLPSFSRVSDPSPDPDAAPGSAARYRWIEGPVAGRGYGIMLVRGGSPRALLTALVPQPLTPVETAKQACDWSFAVNEAKTRTPTPDYSSYTSVVEAFQRDGWTIAYEVNGYREVSKPLMEKLSRDGGMVAVLYYSDGNGDQSFLWADDGAVVRDIEYLGEDSGSPLPQERGLDLTGDDSIAANAALAERLTGISLEPADLTSCGNDLAVGAAPG